MPNNDKIISYDNLALYKELYDQQVQQLLAGKQDVIQDLSDIRSGASAGATAYQKPVNGIPSTDIEEGVIPDVSSFITKSVNDLVNYYTKSQTYTQTEINSLIAAINQFSYFVVSELPTASADTMYKIYLVPSSDPQQQNVKDEYITIRSGEEGSYTYSWEQIGSAAIDLSGYYTSTQIDTLLAGKESKFPIITASSFTPETGAISISAGERYKIYEYRREHGEYARAFVLKYQYYEEDTYAVFVLDYGRDDNTGEYGAAYVANYYCVLRNGTDLAVMSLLFNQTTGDLYSTFQIIPKNLSQLTDDATHRLVTDTEKATWNAKADASTVYTKTQTDTMLGTKQNIYFNTATEDVTNPKEGDVCITAFTELGDFTNQTMYPVPVGVTLRIDPVAGETPSGNLYIMGHPTMMMVDLSSAELPIVTTNEGPSAWTILRMGMNNLEGVTVKQVGPPVRYEYYNGTWLNRDNTAQALPAMQGTYTGSRSSAGISYGVDNPKVGDISIIPPTDVVTDIQDETSISVPQWAYGSTMNVRCETSVASDPAGDGSHDKPVKALLIKNSNNQNRMIKIEWSNYWDVIDYDEQEQPIYGWTYSMPTIYGATDDTTYGWSWDFNAGVYIWYIVDVDWGHPMASMPYTIEEYIPEEVQQHYEDAGIEEYETISIRDLLDIRIGMPEKAYEYQAELNPSTGDLQKSWYEYAKFGKSESDALNALPSPLQLTTLFNEKVDKVDGMSLTHNDWWGWRKEQIDDIVKDLYTDEVVNTNGSWHSISLWQPYENTYTWQAWGLSDWQTAHATEIAHGDYANLWKMDFVFERFNLTINTLSNQINFINVLTYNPAYGEPGEVPYHEFPITDLMVEQFDPGDPYSQHTVYFYTTEKLYGFRLKTTNSFEPIDDETAFTYLLYAQKRTYALASNVPADKVFWATYGTTTYADIVAAVTNGKAVFCKKDNRIYYCDTCNTTSGSTDNIFFSSTDRYSVSTLVVSSSNSWSAFGGNIENSGNKVTSLSSSSTDVQYPSALAVKTYVDNHTPEVATNSDIDSLFD